MDTPPSTMTSMETTFSNRWMEEHGDRHLGGMLLCMGTFHHEYDSVVARTHGEAGRSGSEANDAELEATEERPTAWG